jgi:hypothetical protein
MLHPVARGTAMQELDLDALLAAGKEQTEELMSRLKAMADTSMFDNFRSDGGASYRYAGADAEVSTDTPVGAETNPQNPTPKP